jgi:hypothetical protein
LRILVFDTDRLAPYFGDLQREAAVVILMPDRRIGFGAYLAREAFVDQR